MLHLMLVDLIDVALQFTITIRSSPVAILQRLTDSVFHSQPISCNIKVNNDAAPRSSIMIGNLRTCFFLLTCLLFSSCVYPLMVLPSFLYVFVYMNTHSFWCLLGFLYTTLSLVRHGSPPYVPSIEGLCHSLRSVRRCGLLATDEGSVLVIGVDVGSELRRGVSVVCLVSLVVSGGCDPAGEGGLAGGPVELGLPPLLAGMVGLVMTLTATTEGMYEMKG